MIFTILSSVMIGGSLFLQISVMLNSDWSDVAICGTYKTMSLTIVLYN